MTPATQPAGEPSVLDPVSGLREDLAQHYKPTTGYERLVVGAAAEALHRFQEAQKLERRLFQKVDALELLTNSPDTFKTITRHVADCERAWRKALEEIRRAMRKPQQPAASPNASKPSRPIPSPSAAPNSPELSARTQGSRRE